jgi:phosphoglycolate phosphatase
MRDALGAISYATGASPRAASRYAPIVFDLDGTLVDSAIGIAAALNDARLASEPVAVERVRALVGFGSAHLIREALNIPDAEVPEALRQFRSIYRVDPCRPEHLFPGAERLLVNLRQWGLPLAICTNKPQDLAERVIDRLGLAHYFGAVVGSDPALPEKPDPAPLLRAVAALGGGAPILIGDSMIDALTAQAAGAPFLHAAYGYGRIAGVPVAGVAKSCAEVTLLLEELLRPQDVSVATVRRGEAPPSEGEGERS